MMTPEQERAALAACEALRTTVTMRLPPPEVMACVEYLPAALAMVAAQREEIARLTAALETQIQWAAGETNAAVAFCHERNAERAEVSRLTAALDEARAVEAALREALVIAADLVDNNMGAVPAYSAIIDAALSGATGRAWAEERRALLDVAEAARELRRWDAIGALTSGDEPHASDAQDALRALDAALAKVRP